MKNGFFTRFPVRARQTQKQILVVKKFGLYAFMNAFIVRLNSKCCDISLSCHRNSDACKPKRDIITLVLDLQ